MTNIQSALKYLRNLNYDISGDRAPWVVIYPKFKHISCFNIDIELINLAYLAYIDQKLQKVSKLSINLIDDSQCIIIDPDAPKTSHKPFAFAIFQRRYGYIYHTGRFIWGQKEKYISNILKDITSAHQFYVALRAMGLDIDKGERCDYGDGEFGIEFTAYKTNSTNFSFDYEKMMVDYRCPDYKTTVNKQSKDRLELKGLISLQRINELTWAR